MTNESKDKLIGWLKGLGAAVVSSAAHSVSVMIIDPNTFNLSTGLVPLGKLMVVSAIIGASFYLQKSPLPDITNE